MPMATISTLLFIGVLMIPSMKNGFMNTQVQNGHQEN